MRFHIGVRLGSAVGAYLATALVTAAAILVLRRTISAAQLQAALGFFFIAAIAAGLEPGTVKAAVLRSGPRRAGAAREAPARHAAMIVKALAASPFLALLWRFADPRIPLADLTWTPLVVLAGFAATEQRVVLDIEGRHSAAIWLKQGSLAGGLAILAILIGAGAPLSWAVGASTVARLGLIALTAGGPVMFRTPLRLDQVKSLLGDVRWMELAAVSVLAAAGGSIDRVAALRHLSAGTYASYYLLYEIFSRFWVAPYLITPVLFARLAAGQESGLLMRRAWLGTIAAGAVFVGSVTALCLGAPALTSRFVGASFGAFPIAFAAGVALGALTQLRITELQASGAARRATLIVGLGAAFSAVMFFALVRRLGAEGLMVGWLVKSAAELAAALLGGRLGLARQQL